MNFRIGHVLIRLNNLEEAINDFQNLGYIVTYVSKSKYSRHAMIYFSDQSFIELFCAINNPLIRRIMYSATALLKPLNANLVNRFKLYLGDGNIVDWALNSVPKEEYVSNLLKLKTKLSLSDSKSMKRKDLNNNHIEWQLSLPKDVQVPFFMSEYDPEVRHSYEHSNGVLGIKDIYVETTNRDLIDKFKMLFPKVDSDQIFRINDEQHLYVTQGFNNRITKISLFDSNGKTLYLENSII
ncbi:VOC family protein [Enterococcus sp. DIV1420a]|uniref:VOC family protein n=1 Tax=Enterococcus sp. DIV1420a TaxID=2774672 RepID=UPI003F233C64